MSKVGAAYLPIRPAGYKPAPVPYFNELMKAQNMLPVGITALAASAGDEKENKDPDDIFEDDEKEIDDFAQRKGKWKDRIGEFVPDDSITSQKRESKNESGDDDLVYMHVDDYMRLTGSEFTGRHIDIADKVYSIINKYLAGDSPEKLFKVPSLFLETKDGVDAIVYGVEGRHIAMGLKKAGYDMIPVSLKHRREARYHFGRSGRNLNKKPKNIWSENFEGSPLTTKDYIYYAEEMKNTPSNENEYNQGGLVGINHITRRL
jgi:hypothetical protein